MIRTLVDSESVARHLSDPDWAIIDCRYNLDDEGWGRRGYLASHIPGAAYAHLADDLAGVRTGSNGRHPLPDPAALTRTLGRLGIGNATQVVAYDQDTGMYASRLWWLLRWLGHDAAAVLDGGFARWVAEGRPTSAGEQRHPPQTFTGTPRPGLTVTADDIAAGASRGAMRLVDARSPERYRGDIEPIDKIAGHIPGAANHFFKWNLDDRGLFRPADAIREAFREAVGDTPPERIVCYCGSGVTACHNLLALEHAGIHGAKLYPGSWSEWSSDPSRPIERVGRT